jgi:hypothetical protein
MWDKMVSGCQLAETGFKKAHWMLSQVNPFWTWAFSVTYT